MPPLLLLLCFNNSPSSPCLRVTLLQTLNTSGKTYHSKILKTLKYFFNVWILFTNHTYFWALKGEKTSYKTAFVSCIESDSCIIAFLKVLSKTSKERYLDFKRASLTSQKGVNWKLIYALFVCSLRILFTKPYILTKAIEILKGRSMQNWNVLLLLCLSFLQLTSNSLTCLPSNRSPVTLSFIYSVYKQLVNLSTR